MSTRQQHRDAVSVACAHDIFTGRGLSVAEAETLADQLKRRDRQHNDARVMSPARAHLGGRALPLMCRVAIRLHRRHCARSRSCRHAATLPGVRGRPARRLGRMIDPARNSPDHGSC